VVNSIGNFCARECEPLQPHLTAELISSFFARVNDLYRSLESQDSNTDVSQIINETKAVQAKTAVMMLCLRFNLSSPGDSVRRLLAHFKCLQVQ